MPGDPFNMHPTWVYHYRHPDPEIDAATRITPFDYLEDPEEGEDNPWLDEDIWMEEEPGDWREGGNWPDPDDW